jgi:DNA-binding transcriptional LysR family regulator
MNKLNPSIAPSLDFSDLHLLTVLAQTRSFTQAASRMSISKASVSMRLTALERAAGVALVRRTTRSVSLTPEGEQLVGDLQPAFDLIANSFATVRDLAGAPHGLVRMTAPVALGRQYVAPALPAFLAQHPGVRIELDLSDRIVNLTREGFDLAIRHTPAPPETHVALPICRTRSLLVASPAYLRAHGVPEHPSDLISHNCLLYLRSSGRQAWHFEGPRGSREPERISIDVQGSLRANNSEVLRGAALDGMGIALVPDFSVASHIAPRQLVVVLPRWLPIDSFSEQIYAVRPFSPHVPRAVSVLVAHLRGALGDGFVAGRQSRR